MIRMLYTCDGCGSEMRMPRDERPSGWATVEITVKGFTSWRGGGGKEFAAGRELCERCQIHFRDRLDPKEWPRDAAPQPPVDTGR